MHPSICHIYLRPVIGEGTNGDHEFERDLSVIKDMPIRGNLNLHWTLTKQIERQINASQLGFTSLLLPKGCGQQNPRKNETTQHSVQRGP